MSEWRGLHNPERHKSFSGEWADMPYAECLPELGGCLSECSEGDPCRCCLAAEVERLAERIALAVAFCDEFSGVQVAVTTARILRSGS